MSVLLPRDRRLKLQQLFIITRLLYDHHERPSVHDFPTHHDTHTNVNNVHGLNTWSALGSLPYSIHDLKL